METLFTHHLPPSLKEEYFYNLKIGDKLYKYFNFKLEIREKITLDNNYNFINPETNKIEDFNADANNYIAFEYLKFNSWSLSEEEALERYKNYIIQNNKSLEESLSYHNNMIEEIKKEISKYDEFLKNIK